MRKLKLFLSLLMVMMISVGNVWADPAAVGTTLFSEDFSGYAKDAVPSGSVTTATGRVVYGGANVTYSCTDGGSTTKIFNENTGGGTAPEILVSKSNGTFVVAGIPSGSAKEITVSFTQNKQALSVEPSGTGYSGSISGKPSAVGTRTFDITVADGADATFTLTFTGSGSSNVRVDDILVTVKTAGEGGAPAKTLTSIAVSGAPTKTSYYVGDEFDPAGLVVTGTYSDQSQATITSGITWAYDPSQTLSLNQTSIGVTATVDEISSPKFNVTGLTVTAPVVSNWQVTAPADLETGDVVVLTMYQNSKYYAAANNNGASSAPAATEVAVVNSKLSNVPGETLQWTVTVDESGYQFAVGDNNLYCTNTNNGVRVGTNDNKVFTVAESNSKYYLLNSATTRYLGVYNNQDWRCYTSVNTNINAGSLVIFREPASSKQAAGLAFETTAYLVKANGSLATPTLSTAEGFDGTVTYASSDENVAAVDGSTGALTIKAAGKAVITASSEETDTYKAGSAKYTIFVATEAGTAEDPLTVASAKALINLGCELDVYVEGKVSAITTAYNSTYGNISFDISADGATTGDQVRAFRCVATAQTSVENVDLLADVVVSGTLTKYGSTYELAEGCKLESYTASETPKTDISNDIEHPYTVAVADGLIEDPNSDLSKTVFVKGVVTGFATNKVTIRDTKNGEEYIELYKHTLGENISELLEDEIVIVKGTMQKYSNTTYQMNQGCQVVWKKSVTLVKFLAPVDWENVYAYTFTWDEVNGTTEYDGAWPGKQLTKNGDWYAINVPVDAKVIFHNNLGGDANQTVDIVADESKCYIWKGLAESGKMDVLAVEGCEMKYYIAGSEALTGQNWQHIALNEGNTITFSNVAAGDHEFKITNGTWDWNIGRTYASATGVTLWTEGDNVGFTIAEGKVMNITITYNPATEQITVAAEEVVAQAWSTVKFKAAGSDFAIKENVPQGQAYTIDLTENPWRPGYNFAGWSASEIASASEFTTPLTTITPDADEVTLYAVFSKEITPGSANYVKVTATEDITDGQYLIVYEDGNVAFNGGLETLDAVSNTIGVEIDEDKIASNATTDAAAFTIDVTTGSLQAVSGVYAGVGSYSNGLTSTTTPVENSFAIDGDGNAVIVVVTSDGNMTLRYNSADNQLRFRYYKSGQKAIQLYKKVVTPGTYSYTTDPATIYHIAGTPALTGEGTDEAWAHVALGEGNTITFDNVAAGEYKFKITDGTWSWSKGDAAVDKTNSSGVTFSETDGDGNVVFSVASETSVTITYDAANDKILVVAPIVRNYHIAGDEALTGQDWQHIALNEGNSITFNNVAAGDYEFKITDGTWNWYVSYAAENVDTENSTVTISESESNNNFKFTLAAKSNVTIAYNEETGKVTVNAEAIPEPKNVVILAEYNSKFYAMSNSLGNGALAGVEVEKDGSKIVVSSAEDKAAIQWTATVDGNNTTLKDAENNYIKGSSGASLSLETDPYNWNWDGEKSCYISSAYTNRGLFFNNSGVFKGYATSNLTNDAYAATEVIEIDPENIVVTSKVDPQLAYTPAEVTLTVGEMFTPAVLSYAEGFDGLAAVTYASNNEGVATVDESGVVSLVEDAIGTATITATFAGNNNYLAGSASYLITVNEAGDDLTGTWVLASSVAAGDKIIFAGTYNNVTKTMGKQNTNPNRAAIESSVDEWNVMIPGEGTKVFTLVEAGDNKYAIQASNGKYLSATGTGTKNYLAEADDFEADNAKWAISIENGLASVVASSNNRNVMQYNKSGDGLFSCYDGNQTAIQIFKIGTPDYGSYQRTVTNGNYGTICLPQAGTIEGATLYEIGSFENKMIYVDEVIGGAMEAGKPYIFQATADQLNVTYTSGDVEETAGNANGLHGFYNLENENATLPLADDASLGNYILYSNQYWLVSGRAAYIANYRAYIKIGEINYVAPAPGRRRVAMNVNGTNQATGFENIEASEKPMKLMIDGKIYILRGEKMYDATGRLVK